MKVTIKNKKNKKILLRMIDSNVNNQGTILI